MVVHLLAATSTSALPSPLGTRPRVGFVVSRAVGPAVTRNLVKRRLRHLSRERLVCLPPGSMLVVRALPAAADAGYEQLGDELDRCLTKVGVTTDVPAKAVIGR
jgi:ribonuclease P protein component